MKHVAAAVLTLLVVGGVAVAGFVAWGQRAYEARGPAPETTLFSVPRGASLDRVAEALEEEGLIESASLFRIGARYRGQAEGLRYGEYEIPAGASMAEIVDLLASGRTVSYAITVPEGLISAEVVALLEESPFLTGEIDAIPSEGSLAPETYNVQRGDSRAEVIARMQVLQAEILAEAWDARDPDIAIETPGQALILASIIEKETGVGAERDLVSGVFHNRLREGMRLQTDPAVAYGVTEGRETLDRPLTRTDLTTPTEWNTYLIPGLPPTPIANPGRAAIFAAVQPAETDYYYFVADGTGGHAFAETLAQHNANVREWRRIEAERAQN